MANLFYFDCAYLYNKYSDNPSFTRWFGKFLNSTVGRGGKLIPNELPKSEEEVMLIDWAKSEAKRYMRLYNRSKIIDIPMSMIYIVPDKTHYDSLFVKGLIEERNSNRCFFAAKIFQAIFFRTSFCQVVTDEYKKLFYVDNGTAILKKGIASLLSREFVERAIADGVLSTKDFSEDAFDIESEKAFELFLKDYCSDEEVLSGDDCCSALIEAVINEKSFSQLLKEKKAKFIGSGFLTGAMEKISI
jgi:hypothetical protein